MDSQDLTNILLGVIAFEGAIIVGYTVGGGNRPGGTRPDGSPINPPDPSDPGTTPTDDADKKIG